MNINKRGLIIIVPAITAVLCLVWAGIASWQKTHFSCDAQMTMVDKKGYEDVILHFRFAGETGYLETKGRYMENTGDIIQTSNKVAFSFWLDGDALVMVANETNRFPKVPVPVMEAAPDFFLARERGIRLQLIRKNSAGYLFSYDGAPALYCAITE